jgi:opacity protein-like surface antigen
MKKIFFILSFVFTSSVFALTTEIGVAYSYSKKTFNEKNYYQSDSKSASLSLYLFEKIALEMSYADQFYESQESDTSSTRVVQQSTRITGADITYVMSIPMMFGKAASVIQPYIKGGAAYIAKKKQIKYVNVDVIDIPTKDGFAPSYGCGLKFKLTEKFSVKVGYDVWRTPLDDGTITDDTSFKAGISWYL